MPEVTLHPSHSGWADSNAKDLPGNWGGDRKLPESVTGKNVMSEKEKCHWHSKSCNTSDSGVI